VVGGTAAPDGEGDEGEEEEEEEEEGEEDEYEAATAASAAYGQSVRPAEPDADEPLNRVASKIIRPGPPEHQQLDASMYHLQQCHSCFTNEEQWPVSSFLPLPSSDYW